MNDADCVAFLRWALPHMQLAWPGYRNVRRTVCGRLNRRCRTLGLAALAAYRLYLEAQPAEWEQLRVLCCIPISRFYRDRAVFESLDSVVLPALAAAALRCGRSSLECWSAGCASGEEAYTLAILWELHFAERLGSRLRLRVLATDIDPGLLARAADGCYRRSALKELPSAWLAEAFEQRGGDYCLRERFRAPVRFEHQDIYAVMPDERFDLVLCRNVVFTYFGPELRDRIARRLIERLQPSGALLLGLHEEPPAGIPGLLPWPGLRAVFMKHT